MNKPPSITGATDDGNIDGAAEICLSPSWSDFGGGKKRKEKKRLEREKREHERQQKSSLDPQNGADLAGKRLSKKPPAAMDTQKMSHGLRRNSGNSLASSQPSSHEESRRSSREEGRFSRLSIGSRGKHRSQSTPSTSTELQSDSRGNNTNIVSVAPPQLPKLLGFGWRSRRSSSGTNRTSSGSGEAYEKDLVKFAYSLEASSNSKDTADSTITNHNQRQISSQPAPALPPTPRSYTLSQTAPKILSATETRLVGIYTPPPLLIQRDSQGSISSEKQIDHHGKHQHLVTSGRENFEDIRMQPTGKFMSDEFLQIGKIHEENGAPVPQVQPHKDGSSYVHKQRMYQQQLSIAGYQDELAVKNANEKMVQEDSQDTEETTEGPSVTSTRSPSIKSSKQQTPQTSIDSEGRVEDRDSSQEQSEQHHAFMKDSRHSMVASPAQSPQVSRSDKIFGFRPFQKKSKQPKIPTSNSIVPAENRSKPTLSLQYPLTPRPALPSQKALKVERMLEELMPASANKILPRSPQHINEKTQKEDIPERPTLQTHSRTRTSSSQLLHENVLISKKIPRSSTAPVLTVTPKQTSLDPGATGLDTKGERSRQPEPASSKKNTPQGPRSPPADIKTLSKTPQELIVEGVNGEGLVHKTSITRPRSNPQMLTTTVSPAMPSLDFLPQLKHQPLIKPKRTSPVRPKFITTPDKTPFLASSQFPVPSTAFASTSDPQLPSFTSAPDLKIMPRSPLRPPADTSLLRPGVNTRRRTMGPVSFGKGSVTEGLDTRPTAKLFVICCKCNFWHDLPSNIYKLMAAPHKLSRRDCDEGGAAAAGGSAGSASGSGNGSVGGSRDGVTGGLSGVKEARLDTMVQCPWCAHPMTTWCCAGWTAVVYMHERHH